MPPLSLWGVLILVVRLPGWFLGVWVVALPLAAVARDWRPCPPDTPAYREADQELQAIDGEMSRLAPGADAEKLFDRILRLTDSRCLKPVGLGACETPSALALQTYWRDGGAAHFRSYLDLGKPGKRVVSEPPSLRETLGYEKLPPGHPLHFLVCPPADASCGADTAAWAASTAGEDGELLTPQTVQACERRARKAAPRRRFERFTECLGDLQSSSQVFPLGRLRLPERGWLIVLGPDGHGHPYQLRAYDLSSGAMIGVSGCDGWPRDDAGCRPAGRFKVRLQLGHASAARESAWRLLMDETLDPVTLQGISAELPAGIVPTLPPARSMPPPLPPYRRRITMLASITSSASTVTWKIVADGRTLGTGKLGSWDHSEQRARAVDLVDAAERSFAPGCPRTSPPPDLVDVGLGVRASEIPPDYRGLRMEHDQLTAAWNLALADLRACQKR